MKLSHFLLVILLSIGYSSTAFLFDPAIGRRPLFSLYESLGQIVKLSSGTSAQVLTGRPTKTGNSLSQNTTLKPPLIFLHGSFHAAWCWTEHYFHFFTHKGYPCYAFSFQGTGGTPASHGTTRVKIMDHVKDLTAFIEYVTYKESQCTDGSRAPPVLIAHSFAGLAVMKYLENIFSPSVRAIPSISGIAMLCSVPPSGNGKMTLRFLRRSLSDSWKITVGMAMKKCTTNENLCRTLFFGGDKRTVQILNDKGEVTSFVDDGGISDDDLKRYMVFLARDSIASIDLGDLAKKLPSNHVDKYGRAIFFDQIPNTLVVGATQDFIVDKEGVEETSTYFGVQPIFVDSPHDIMLGRNYLKGAMVIEQWLQTLSTSFN